MHRRPFLLINNGSVEAQTRWREGERRGHADDTVSLLITVVGPLGWVIIVVCVRPVVCIVCILYHDLNDTENN